MSERVTEPMQVLLANTGLVGPSLHRLGKPGAVAGHRATVSEPEPVTLGVTVA